MIVIKIGLEDLELGGQIANVLLNFYGSIFTVFLNAAIGTSSFSQALIL